MDAIGFTTFFLIFIDDFRRRINKLTLSTPVLWPTVTVSVPLVCKC